MNFVIIFNNEILSIDYKTVIFQTFDDGSLYISNLGLHHMGNYTCQDTFNEHIIQTHILRVQSKYNHQQRKLNIITE